MLNLVFNVEHEFYCLHYRPGCLSTKQAILLPIKIFINILALALILTAPITIGLITCAYLDGNL